MLSLQLKSGEYLTIGDDIAVQVFQTGPSFRVSVKAPREVPILRGEVLERSGQRPEGLRDRRPKSPSEKARNAKNLDACLQRREREDTARKNQANLLQNLETVLDRMDELADTAARREIQALRGRLEQLRAELSA